MKIHSVSFKILFFSLIILLSFSGCVVQAPKYSKVELVLLLKPGMTQEEVKSLLGIPPYDMKSINENETVLIYKYRVTDRKTIPFLMKPANGMNATGKWVDLFITFSKEGKVVKIESCSECGETKTKQSKLDLNALITFISFTLPALLLYLGLQD